MAKISIHGDVVTMVQSTKVKGDVSVELTQEYDFTNTPKATLIQWATANRVIAWRAHNDVKELTQEQILALPTTIDCSAEFESTRKVRVENPLLTVLKARASELGITPEALLAQLSNTAVKL